MPKLRIRWVRSQIGYAQPQRRTIRALGLRRLQHSVVHEDTPTIRGMLLKVRHMIHVEVAEASETPKTPKTSEAEKK